MCCGWRQIHRHFEHYIRDTLKAVFLRLGAAFLCMACVRTASVLAGRRRLRTRGGTERWRARPPRSAAAGSAAVAETGSQTASCRRRQQWRHRARGKHPEAPSSLMKRARPQGIKTQAGLPGAPMATAPGGAQSPEMTEGCWGVTDWSSTACGWHASLTSCWAASLQALSLEAHSVSSKRERERGRERAKILDGRHVTLSLLGICVRTPPCPSCAAVQQLCIMGCAGGDLFS